MDLRERLTPPCLSGTETLQKTPSSSPLTRPHHTMRTSDDRNCSIVAQVAVRETVAEERDDLSTTIKKVRGAASWAPADGLDFAARRVLPRLPLPAERLVGVLGRKTRPTYVSARPDPSVGDQR